MNHPLVTVYFKFYCQGLQDIRISGNTENTGNWDPELAFPLVCAEDCYTGTLFLPHDQTLEYKYIFYSENIIWEPFPNRKVHCKSALIHVNDFFDSPISEIFYQSDIPKPHHHEKLPEINENIKFNLSDSIIFANFNLPIKVSVNPLYGGDDIHKKWVIEKNKGIWLPVLYDITNAKHVNILWIGWPGIIIEDEEEQACLTEYLMKEHKCFPIFLTENLLSEFNRFCNVIIFPLFNNIIHINAAEIPQYSIEQWEVYKNVNSIFAEAIMNNYLSQVIWINDYTLMLTPNFVSRRIHELLNIGFYMHCPFPSADVFRGLPHGEAILHSILACDLVSFHNYDYASDFLKTCKQLISIEHHFSKEGYLLIEHSGRHIMLRVGDIGIESEKIDEITASSDYLQMRQQILREFSHQKVLLGIDSLSKLSGIPLKLKRFKAFLQKKSSEIVLLQYITKPKILMEDARLLSQILETCAEINKIAGRAAVILKFEDLTQVQRYALMSESIGYFNCCLKDSMCLVPYEYLIVNKDSYKPVIVSETAGVSRSLRSFIKINPYSEGNVIEALLNLEESQNVQFRQHDIEWVLKNNMQRWAYNFLSDLKRAQKNPRVMQYMKLGMGDKMKLMALKKNFSKLDLESLLITYKRANYRAMFFDNEGTLVDSIKNENSKCAPQTKLLDCLTSLAKDPQNVIFIITGREKKFLDSVYNIPHLGLAAEYGSFIRWSHKQEWESRFQINELWKDTAKHIIESYTLRTEGAYLEEKEFSVVFQYKNCDSEYGSWQAKELVAQLDVLLNPYVEECEVVEGTGYVEVKPRRINKGVTIEYIMQECHKSGVEFDFVLSIGDDYSDEEMFKVLKQLSINKSPVLSTNSRCFSCTLVRKPTEADYYLNDSSEILQYLEALKHWTLRDPEIYNNWNSSMHIVDIVKSDRRISIDQEFD